MIAEQRITGVIMDFNANAEEHAMEELCNYFQTISLSFIMHLNKYSGAVVDFFSKYDRYPSLSLCTAP